METDSGTARSGLTQVTRLLLEAKHGITEALPDLLPLVYEELRKLATHRMQGERKDHTLQATALVHEAYARLVGDKDLQWSYRAHFFAAAAEAMRRILIGHARAKQGQRRGKLEIVNKRNVSEIAQTKWEGRIGIRHGEESQVYVEVANSSSADVLMERELVDDVSPVK